MLWKKPKTNSTLIDSVAHDPGVPGHHEPRLLVRFLRSPQIYAYPNATAEHADGIIAADSAGKAFNQFKGGRDFYTIFSEDDPRPKKDQK